MNISLTGRLLHLTRSDLIALIRRSGHRFQPRTADDTDILIVGDGGWPAMKNGKITGNLERARKFQAGNFPLRIMREEEWLNVSGNHEVLQKNRGAFSISQMSRILKAPERTLRYLRRLSLIHPVRTVNRMQVFDYHSLHLARDLLRLAQQGVSFARIREIMETIPGEFSTGEGAPKIDLVNGILASRWGQDLLAERGQFLLDFREEKSGQITVLSGNLKPDDILAEENAFELFDRAVAAEDRGEIQTAIRLYEKALEDRDNPLAEACFNLGNLHYDTGSLAMAAARFLKAIEIDENFVEAWNNLGSILYELNDFHSAERALKKAVRVEPEYADAHYNLARVLIASGNLTDARTHLLAYLKLDPATEFSGEVRRLLTEISGKDLHRRD